MNKDNIYYMSHALNLAKNVKGNTSPNPAVGAVLVNGNEIIAEGVTQKAGMDHAEVVAIKKAGNKAKDSTLYVTLEPCCYHGKTPPCTNLIIKSKIKKVVIGTLDPNPQVNGKGVDQLKKAGIYIEVGYLENDINELNEDFNKYITTGLPFAIAKYAMTLDGKIATFIGDSKWISNNKSRNLVHKLRNKVDGILVGVNTVINDNPKLTVRLDNKIKNPVRIVVDSSGKTPSYSNVFKDKYDTIFALKEHALDSIHRDYFLNLCKDNNKKILFDDSHSLRINMPWLFRELAKLGLMSIMIEGGGEVLASTLKAELIDKVICFIGPKIVLGNVGVFPFGGEGFENIADSYLINKVKLTQIDNDIMITGYVNYK